MGFFRENMFLELYPNIKDSFEVTYNFFLLFVVNDGHILQFTRRT